MSDVTGENRPVEDRSGRRVLVKVLSVLAGVVAVALAGFVGFILVGAYFPNLPKAGLLGPVLAGQYPLHVFLLAVTGLILSLLAWRGGLRRFGRVMAWLTGVATVFALVTLVSQVWFAIGKGTQISWSEMLTELVLPATEPDHTVVYASPGGHDLEVDLYLPAERPVGGVPAVILAHAGGFHTFDKSDLRGTARWLADRGVAALPVDYRLATHDQPTWDRAPQDLVCALDWVRRHATEYGIDPGQVSIGGMSAGGTLALNAGYRLVDGSIESSCGNAPEPPYKMVGFYPGVDVVQLWTLDFLGSRPAAERFTGGTPAEVGERYREVSPNLYLRSGLMPTLLVAGDRDHSSLPELIEGFGASLEAFGVQTQVAILPFADHAFDDAYGSLAAQTSRQILLDFVLDNPR